MFDFKQIEIWQIFLWISFFYFLYKFEETIEEETYKKKSKKVLAFLIATSTLVAGIIGTVIWLMLEEMKISFTVFEIQIQLKGFINVFIAITIPLFYKEMANLTKRKMNIIASKEE